MQGAEDRGALLAHSDQYRGLKYCYTQMPDGPGATIYAEPSPDYFQYVDLGGEGLTPVGYGYRSVEHIVSSIIRLESEPEDRRGKLLDQFDRHGIMATPRNSGYNELVIEAGRQSILDGGTASRDPGNPGRGVTKYVGASLAGIALRFHNRRPACARRRRRQRRPGSSERRSHSRLRRRQRFAAASSRFAAKTPASVYAISTAPTERT